MERLHCPNCGNEVFFDSLRCVRCKTELTVELGTSGTLSILDAAAAGTCAMREPWRCNWLPNPPGNPEWRCDSCLIVDPGSHAANRLLVPFLAAQRRGLAQLTMLGVDWSAPPQATDGGTGATGATKVAADPSHPPLQFTYRSRSAGDPATIGHLGGLITLDLDEADPAHGEQVRATLGEHYRTPLGHIRHELGHYVWLRYVANDADRLARFRAVFGDETADYASAIDRHYGRVDDGSWRKDYVSFYASAHPWEDFAESWAQVMHIHDVVSTGAAWGVVDARVDEFDPRQWLSAAVLASLAANELARAMGMRDLYPFALSTGARRRIEAAWDLVHPTPAPGLPTEAGADASSRPA